MHSKQPGPAAAAAPDGRSELGALTKPGRCRQHVAQAESRVRPLVRRAPRIERPARVRMRRRKPWVLARRRLFGWKVRLLTRRLLALGTTGLRSFGRCVLPAVAVRNSMLRHCAAPGDELVNGCSANISGRGRSEPWKPQLSPHPCETVHCLAHSGQPGCRHAASSRRRLDRATVRGGGRSGQTGRAARCEPGRPVPGNAITPAQVSPGPARPGNHRWVNRSVCRAAGDAVTRHARPDKKCPARCGQPLAARPTGLLASPVVGRLPYPSRARSAALRAAPR